MEFAHIKKNMTIESTLFINLIGGPCCGKSTLASGLFYRLKRIHINCELIQEYAKDKTWSEDKGTLQCQPYVTGKQYYRTIRLLDKVDIAVTDSPFILGLLYKGIGCNEAWCSGVVESFKGLNNLNILLIRNSEHHRYNPLGRSQTKEEAILKDIESKALLDKENIPYTTVEMSEVDTNSWNDPCLNEIYSIVMARFKSENNLK